MASVITMHQAPRKPANHYRALRLSLPDHEGTIGDVAEGSTPTGQNDSDRKAA